MAIENTTQVDSATSEKAVAIVETSVSAVRTSGLHDTTSESIGASVSVTEASESATSLEIATSNGVTVISLSTAVIPGEETTIADSLVRGTTRVYQSTVTSSVADIPATASGAGQPATGNAGGSGHGTGKEGAATEAEVTSTASGSSVSLVPTTATSGSTMSGFSPSYETTGSDTTSTSLISTPQGGPTTRTVSTSGDLTTPRNPSTEQSIISEVNSSQKTRTYVVTTANRTSPLDVSSPTPANEITNPTDRILGMERLHFGLILGGAAVLILVIVIVAMLCIRRKKTYQTKKDRPSAWISRPGTGEVVLNDLTFSPSIDMENVDVDRDVSTLDVLVDSPTVNIFATNNAAFEDDSPSNRQRVGRQTTLDGSEKSKGSNTPERKGKGLTPAAIPVLSSVRVPSVEGGSLKSEPKSPTSFSSSPELDEKRQKSFLHQSSNPSVDSVSASPGDSSPPPAPKGISTSSIPPPPPVPIAPAVPEASSPSPPTPPAPPPPPSSENSQLSPTSSQSPAPPPPPPPPL